MKSLLTLLSAALLLVGCGDRFPDYHYKMTIYARGKVFSSVRAIEQEEVSSFVDSSGRMVKTRVSGEAVIIDLDGQTYYALLSKPDDPDFAATPPGNALGRYIARDAPLSEVDEAIKDYREDTQDPDPTAYLGDAAEASRRMVAIKGPRDLPRTIPNSDHFRGPRQIETWPMFVTFGDPTDPKTVREVSPESIGVSNITVEITDEDLTTGIEERLGWLVSLKSESARLSGNPSIVISNADTSLGERLGVGAFQIENGK